MEDLTEIVLNTELLSKKVTIWKGDCLKSILEIPDDTVDSIVCDPPYHLASIVKRFGKEGSAAAKFGTDGAFSRASKGFMGMEWDGGDIAFCPETWSAFKRVLKPGGYMLAFAAAKNAHQMITAIEDAGFEVLDTFLWVYGCYSEDTECLTKNGWKNYSELTLDDEILQWDKNTNELTWTNPKNIFVYDAPEEMVHIQNRHTDQLLTKNHRVYTKIRKHSRNPAPTEFSVIDAQDLKSHWHKTFPVAGRCDGGEYEQFAYIIGWWLTDAWVHSDGEACMFSQSKTKTLHKLRATLKRMPCIFSEYTKESKVETHAVEHTFYVRGELAENLITNYPERELVWDFLEWNFKSRYRLLEGLLDGDGTRKNDRGYSEVFWSQNSKRLDIVQAICVSLNIRSHIDYEKGCVYLNRRKNTTQLQQRHVLEIIPYSGKKVWCVETETGAFVVRRNGRAFISGNSGFPKSYDISKGIDKKFDAHRVIIDTKRAGKGALMGGLVGFAHGAGEYPITAPSTNQAKQWEGWGTALKPAYEPICLARKPDDNKPEVFTKKFFYAAKADNKDRKGSKHPTVKPVKLMRELCRLVTPEGGTVLDPFAGSGTTGEAAYLEGFNTIMFEREDDYINDIIKRFDEYDSTKGSFNWV